MDRHVRHCRMWCRYIEIKCKKYDEAKWKTKTTYFIDLLTFDVFIIWQIFVWWSPKFRFRWWSFLFSVEHWIIINVKCWFLVQNQSILCVVSFGYFFLKLRKNRKIVCEGFLGFFSIYLLSFYNFIKKWIDHFFIKYMLKINSVNKHWDETHSTSQHMSVCGRWEKFC